MKKSFSLFQNHLDLAHQYWTNFLAAGDLAVDATCGNGHDTVFLAKKGARVISIDVQQDALDQAKVNAEEEGVADQITFLKQCHSTFPEEIEGSVVKLFVYNLGYLPGGDKDLTTKVETTLQSIRNAMVLLANGGMISITCYPGHEEGEREEAELLNFCRAIDPKEWSCCHHRWVNRNRSPSLVLLQKAAS